MIEEWKEKMNKNEKEREEEKKRQKKKKCRKMQKNWREIEKKRYCYLIEYCVGF